MNIFLNFFSQNDRKVSETPFQKLLNDLSSGTSSALPHNYEQILQVVFDEQKQKSEAIESLLDKLLMANTIPDAIKSITVIFKMIQVSKYDRCLIDNLENIELPKIYKSENNSNKWIDEPIVACISYLVKVPSITDLFIRALNCNNGQPLTTYLSDCFRIINQVNLLFPNLNNTINTIGRYYMTNNHYFHQFYKVIRQDLLVSYSYLKIIIEKIQNDYKECQLNDLDCFIKCLPEIQLICDRIEDFLLNKYFKGKSPNKKIYFKEEKISEILYYLSLENKNRKKDQNTKTTEEEFFGAYQESI